jgi:chemotaxis protein methyltransferase CheR
MSSLGPFDFVLCRNVLIYFDLETKKSILRGISRTLASGGFLLLGAAETTLNLSDAFERRSVSGASFYCKLEVRTADAKVSR